MKKKSNEVKEVLTAFEEEGFMVLPIKNKKLESSVTFRHSFERISPFTTGLPVPREHIDTLFELGNEMGLNVRDHTGGGVFLARMIKDKGDIGVEFVVLDRGPGIKDLSQALEMGWSGGKGSGYGMYVLRSVADEFEVESVVGSGTKIVGRKFFKA